MSTNNSPGQRPRFGIGVLILVTVALCACCLFPVPTVRDTYGYQVSLSNLGMLAWAFRAYHDVNGHFPPAVINNPQGQPLYSWRVVLLPYLEQGQLYAQFKLDEPWDSPHNQPLLAQVPRCYRPGFECAQPPYATPFQVFVGPGTAFERVGLTQNDVPDGLANTVLVVEAKEPVPWTAPQDLAYAPDLPVPLLGGRHSKPVHLLRTQIELQRKPRFCALFADGSIRFLDSKIKEPVLRGIITRNGGEAVDSSGATLEFQPARP